jgi:hypothetical protein
MQRKLGQNATTQHYITENQVWRLVSDKIGMERACFTENDNIFSQSKFRPPMSEPLLFGLRVSCPYSSSEEILANTYKKPSGVDEYTAKLINKLQIPEVI